MSTPPPGPRPEPVASRDSAFFWQGLRENQLLGQHCDGCQRFRHPPRPACPHCGSFDWSAVPLSGRGSVHAWIRPQHPPMPMFGDDYVVALIELDEGIRLLSNLCEVGAGEIRTGMPVEVFFIDVGESGARLHQFRPRAEAANG